MIGLSVSATKLGDRMSIETAKLAAGAVILRRSTISELATFATTNGRTAAFWLNKNQQHLAIADKLAPVTLRSRDATFELSEDGTIALKTKLYEYAAILERDPLLQRRDREPSLEELDEFVSIRELVSTEEEKAAAEAWLREVLLSAERQLEHLKAARHPMMATFSLRFEELKERANNAREGEEESSARFTEQLTRNRLAVARHRSVMRTLCEVRG